MALEISLTLSEMTMISDALTYMTLKSKREQTRNAKSDFFMETVKSPEHRDWVTTPVTVLRDVHREIKKFVNPENASLEQRELINNSWELLNDKFKKYNVDTFDVIDKNNKSATALILSASAIGTILGIGLAILIYNIT